MNGNSIGTSILSAGRRGLDIVGQNIANASTPGYSRQRLNFVNRVSTNGVIGLGVEISSITRYQAPVVRAAILRGSADQGGTGVRLQAHKQIESYFGTSPNTIGEGIERLFNQIEQLTARPDNSALRRTVLGAASDLAGQFQSSAGDIDRLRFDVKSQAIRSVAEINDLAKRIAQFNIQISNAEGAGTQANDLKDQRDQLISQLSQRIDIRTVEQPYGAVNVLSGGAAIVVGEFAGQFQLTSGPGDTLQLVQNGGTDPIRLSSGSLLGQMQLYNTEIPSIRSRLDGLARGLIAGMNAIQATGLGTTGPLASLTGSIFVSDPNQPLATQDLPFPLTSGNLVVSVTEVATGVRSNVVIPIDPSTQSLSDVAAAISSATGGQVSAAVNADNRLELQALAGYQFDFAGRDTNPAGGGAVAEPDEAGLLTALGLGGIFLGTDATTIRVDPGLLAAPERLAASSSGEVGDASNLERLASLRDRPLFTGRTIPGEFNDLLTGIGGTIRGLSDSDSAQSGILASLFAQEQSVVGVDLNEELVQLLEFQRMVDAGSRYLSVVNRALDSILEIVR